MRVAPHQSEGKGEPKKKKSHLRTRTGVTSKPTKLARCKGMIQLPTCQLTNRGGEKFIYFVCVVIKNPERDSQREGRNKRFKSKKREATNEGRQRHSRQHKRRRDGGAQEEGAGVPGGERVDEGEQHLELAAAVGGEACVHLDDHGVDDLSQARRRRSAALRELPEQRDGAPPARPRGRPARHEHRGDRARGRRAARRHPEPDPPHPPRRPAPSRLRLGTRAAAITASQGRALLPPPREQRIRTRARDAASGRRRATEWRMGRDGMEQRAARRGG